MTTTYSYKNLLAAVKSSAILSTTISLQPPNPGEPVSPPTYKGKDDKSPPQYLKEIRLMKSEMGTMLSVPCVILDTLFSQANRQEAALLDLYKAGKLDIPVISVECDAESFPEELRSFLPNPKTYVLEMSHRISDAHVAQAQITSEVPGKKGKSTVTTKDFSKSALGGLMLGASPKNITLLFQHSLESLLYGFWNSRENSTPNSKFQRAMVSTVVGWDIVEGTGYTGGAVDVWGITNCVQAYPSKDSLCTLDPVKSAKKKNLSAFGYTNFPPSAGVDLRRQFACREITLSSHINLTYLRTLHFGDADSEAGRAVLAALGIVALAAQHQNGYSLRSGCLLFSEEPTLKFEVQGVRKSAFPAFFEVSLEDALEVYHEAVEHARKAGIGWKKGFELALTMKDCQKKLLEASIRDGMDFKSEKGVRAGGSDDVSVEE